MVAPHWTNGYHRRRSEPSARGRAGSARSSRWSPSSSRRSGSFSAMGLLWGVAFHWLDLALFAGFYVVCAFGTTIGFHRYFTHRGFETAQRRSRRRSRSSAA